MSNARSVFISYGRSDRSFVEGLADLLEAAGHSPVYDTEALKMGQDFPAALARSIRESDEVILVLSVGSVESEWVYREMSFAIEAGKSIRIVEQEENVGLPDRFRILIGNIQRATIEDIRHPRAGSALQRILDGESTESVPVYRLPQLAKAATVFAIAALLGVCALIFWPRSDKWAMQNIEFVVDSSQYARSDFRGSDGQLVSKLEAIELALADKIDKESGTSMALRVYGMPESELCESTDLLVGFQRDNGAEIVGRVDGLEVGGAASLYLGVQNALEDLQVAPEDLPSEYATRKVIVLATAPDDCDRVEADLARQIEELAASGVKLELRLVGLDFDADEVADLSRTFDRVCGDQCNSVVVGAANGQQLLTILNEWIRVEPMFDLLRAVGDINVAATEASNRAVDAANRLDAESFDAELSTVRDLLGDAQTSFDEMSERVSLENGDGRYNQLLGAAAESNAGFADWISELNEAKDIVRSLAEDPDDVEVLDEWNLKVDSINETQLRSADLDRRFFDLATTLIDEIRADA